MLYVIYATNKTTGARCKLGVSTDRETAELWSTWLAVFSTRQDHTFSVEETDNVIVNSEERGFELVKLPVQGSAGS